MFSFNYRIIKEDGCIEERHLDVYNKPCNTGLPLGYVDKILTHHGFSLVEQKDMSRKIFSTEVQENNIAPKEQLSLPGFELIEKEYVPEYKEQILHLGYQNKNQERIYVHQKWYWPDELQRIAFGVPLHANDVYVSTLSGLPGEVLVEVLE
jgi:hypothetical protein